MSSGHFADLGEAVLHEHFPEVDVALRRGRHIDQHDVGWYEYLVDANGFLEPFYKRFGAELVHVADGYFYLLPTTDRLGKRHLSVPEMLVGQALALMYLDPLTVQKGGNVTREEVLSHLASVMGTDALMRVLHGKKRRVDERVAQEAVRHKVYDAIRRLAALGFVEILTAEQVRLRPALLRFADPVRGADSPAEALAKLVAKGEAVLGDGADALELEDAEGALGTDETGRAQRSDEGDDELADSDAGELSNEADPEEDDNEFEE